MKISPELEKKFLEVSIKLSKADKDNAFFRRRDPNILINLAKVHTSRGNKSVSLVNLRALYKKDSDIRVALFGLIQNIEEKLTGVIVQRISYDHPDFHLRSKNFDLLDEKNSLTQFKSITTFIFNLRREHKYMIDNSYTIPENGYIPMETFISKISMGLKAKLLRYSKLEYRNLILSGFGIKQNAEADFTIDFMSALNLLRNNVMHHETVTDWVWKSNFGDFDIFEFIEIATYFTAEFDMTSLDGIRTKPFRKCTKATMVKITSSPIKVETNKPTKQKVVVAKKKESKAVNNKQTPKKQNNKKQVQVKKPILKTPKGTKPNVKSVVKNNNKQTNKKVVVKQTPKNNQPSKNKKQPIKKQQVKKVVVKQSNNKKPVHNNAPKQKVKVIAKNKNLPPKKKKNPNKNVHVKKEVVKQVNKKTNNHQNKNKKKVPNQKQVQNKQNPNTPPLTKVKKTIKKFRRK